MRLPSIGQNVGRGVADVPLALEVVVRGERLDASFSAALSAGLNVWSQRPNEANGANTQSPEALTQRMDKEAPATNDFHVCGVRAEGAGRLDIPTGLGSVRGSLNGVSPM